MAGIEEFQSPTSIIGSIEIAGSTDLKGAIKLVPSQGARVQLPSYPCSEVIIVAQRSNTGFIFVGGNDVTSAVYGVSLASLESITLSVTNTNLIYLDATVDGDGVSYVAL